MAGLKKRVSHRLTRGDVTLTEAKTRQFHQVLPSVGTDQEPVLQTFQHLSFKHQAEIKLLANESPFATFCHDSNL